ncbi:MAG: PAS domain S-box protein [Anaerolineales bacterium]|nr:PAS domain S-box protein [Anaerolineales bacterium]
MSNQLQVLIVEDSESDAAMIVRILSKAGYDVQIERVEDAKQMQAALAGQPWDVVISDYSLPQFDAPTALAVLQQSGLDIPFIVVSGTVGEEVAVKMMKAGAHDYLMKDNLIRLAPAVAREIREAQSRQERRQTEETLKVLTERLSSIFRAAPVGIGVALDRSLKEVNQCILDMTGYSRAELIEQSARLLYPTDEEFERVGREKYAQLRGQGIGIIETKWQRKDGSVRDILLSSTQLNPDDEAAGMTFTALDITARKQAEESLRRSEERYRTVADYTYDWEYWVGPDGLWLYCSPSCERVTGYPAQHFLNDPGFLKEIIHPDDRPTLAHHLTEANNTAQVENIDFRIIHRDGTIRWLNHICQPVWGHDGQWLGRRASNRNITERKRAEETLRASETRFSTIFHANPAAITITRLADNHFVDVNEAWQVLTGYSYAEVVGHTPYELNLWVKPQQRDAMLKTLREQGMTRGEIEIRHKSGRIAHVLLAIDLIELVGERYILTMGQDITERKQLAAENEQLAAQFYQAQKIESIGRLAGGIAHDFNNLLVPIIGYTELGMLKLSSDSSLYADLKRIKDAGERAASLTRQILAFSRQQMLEMKLLDLNQVISEFEPMLRRLIGEDIDLKLNLTADLPCLKADKGQLEQVLLNLVVNARDAMPDGGALIIETGQITLDRAYVAKHPEAQTGPHALLTVSDTGHGMDAAIRLRIFEPFFTTKDQGKGTGLGLATVFGIVKQHGGNIWVYSEPGHGTSFKIYLPLADAPASIIEPESPQTGALNGVETVLLVEDEASVRQLVGDTLAMYGYRVLVAPEPEKGLTLADGYKGTIHLLLSDVVMPQMRGRS